MYGIYPHTINANRNLFYGKDRFIVRNVQYTIVDKGDETVANLYIYDEISAWWGTSKQSILAELKDNNVSKINLHISSLGGDVDHALAIKNLIKGHPAKVDAYLSGFVASSATVVMLGADRIFMAEDALVLIHNASTGIWGNKESLRDLADELDTVDAVLINLYVKKTGKAAEEIAAQMKLESWMNAEEALAFGLVDEIVEKIAVVASMRAKYANDKYYNNFKIKAPDMILKNMFHGKGKKPTIAAVLTAQIKAAAKAQGKTEDEIINNLSEESLIPVVDLKAIMAGAKKFTDTKGKEQNITDSELSVFAEVLEFDAKLFTDEVEAPAAEPEKEEEEETVAEPVIDQEKIDAAIAKAVEKAFAANKGKDIDQKTLVAALSAEFTGVVGKFTNTAAVKITNLSNELKEAKTAAKKVEDKVDMLTNEIAAIKGGPSGGGSGKKAGSPFDFKNEDLDGDEDKYLAASVKKGLENRG